MQSEAGKVLYSKTVLKHCTSIEHLWKRKLLSLTSHEHWEIFLPRSERSWRADVLYTPLKSLSQWVQISIGRQCWNICPPCGQRQALPLNLPHELLHSALPLCHGQV